ncbi:MAG: aspartate carbamoyltransferase regulatory subunit [Bacteroidetes bacterium]|jgi:aspartate carbamoyltransferase regulatory subunit|nr:aspartate carbamoyltransferase regulatory subunit [Bacteroidota bacterium]
MHDKVLNVSAIKNGTVIDHIPATSLFEVISILGLHNVESQITFGTNLESKKLGKKAIIKLSEVYLMDDEINKISLVAPQAKLNIIKNFEVVEKKIVEVPENVVGIVKCFNPSCITNHERIVTRFKVLSMNELRLKCHYCEKITDHEHMEII